MMEKYAVVMDDEKSKTAGDGIHCPKCGRELRDDVNNAGWIQKCPSCGTEPFEKRSP